VSVPAVPETRYADTAVGRIAYQLVGECNPDLLVFHPLLFPIDLMWDEPTLVRFLERLASFTCSIWFDPRGRGASDPLSHAEERFAEAGADDMLALLDFLGCKRVAVLGLGTGPPTLFAASHPERTRAVIQLNTGHYGLWRLLLTGAADDELEQTVSRLRRNWGTGASLDVEAPSVADDDRLRRWLARCERLTCTPNEAEWRVRATIKVDLRAVLPLVQVPTLVIHRAGDTPAAAETRSLAKRIPGVREIDVPGEDFFFFVGDTAPMLDAMEEFLTGALPAHRSDRVLATVLFTDIVSSTEQLTQMGDRHFKELLVTHDELLRAEVERFRGRLVRSTGDGVLATFEGPGRAVRCACALRDAVRPLGVEIRAGLHSGEIELRGDDVAGMAVHIAARVSARAGAGEVLVSRTVTDLVAGSGIEFEDRGEHELKGSRGPGTCSRSLLESPSPRGATKPLA
jgi:class 3 adenylate cyclase